MKKVTDINLIIGKAIRNGLANRGMTQGELANIVGSTQRSISAYINGNAQPPLDILSMICKELHINMNQLLHIPDYDFPGRVVHDPIELYLLEILDEIPEQKKMTFLHLIRDIVTFEKQEKEENENVTFDH